MAKTYKLLISVALSFVLTSCFNDIDSSQNSGDSDNPQINPASFGMDSFLPDSSAEFQVIFFDNDNVVSKNGKSFEKNIKNDQENNNKPSDVYLIKSGNTEILVDAGTQERGEQKLLSSFGSNFVKKIATYVSDGVLEYLIITHPDYDHIAYLTFSGGLLDLFYNYDNWIENYNNDEALTDIFGRKFKGFKKIENIIDFDTHRVRQQSKDDLSNKLVTSENYKLYCEKRDRLEKNKGTKYFPASLFFHTVMEEKSNLNNSYMSFSNFYNIDDWFDWINSESRPHYVYGVPSQYLENFRTFENVYHTYSTLYLNTIGPQGSLKQYASTQSFVDGEKDYQIGTLKSYKIKQNSSYRYTYDIKIGTNVYLKFLYNWHFDNYKAGSFTSSSINDLSVPFIVESKTGKFLSTGDGSGEFESALINYYNNTDVLEDVLLFKAAHHGSVSNGENSKAFYEIMTPEVVVITGTIQPSRDKIETNDPLYNLLANTVTLKQQFFDNIGHSSVKILVNKVVATTNGSYFQNQPMYGDIKIVFKKNQIFTHYNFIGKVESYINKEKQNIEFETYVDDEHVYLMDTKWFDVLGFKKPKGK